VRAGRPAAGTRRPDGWFARAALADRLGPQPSGGTTGTPGPVVLAGPDTDADWSNSRLPWSRLAGSRARLDWLTMAAILDPTFRSPGPRASSPGLA
jgi:hypothetical protein